MPASIKHLTDRRVIYNSLLARWKDGLYYTAVLTKCDRANKKCRVCFEDGSEIWVSNRDLHIQLTLDQLSEDEDIVCCICDDGNSEPPNEIILCDVCQQGYHQNCHLPPVDASKLDDSEESKDHKDWFCATCSFILNQTNRAKLSATVAAAQQQQQQQHERPTRANSSVPSSSKQQQQQQAPKQQVPKQDPKTVASTSNQPTEPKHIPQPTVIAAPVKAVAPEKTMASKQALTFKQPPKVKQTPGLQQMGSQKSTIGAVKSDVTPHQRSAPYYPLSSQARAMATSSTAALASLTASSALVVGSSAGRTKQDLVKQSNRSTQRQIINETGAADTGAVVPKHAVRKSSVNFSSAPIKQSALPTATRSSPSGASTMSVARNSTVQAARAIVTAKPATTISVPPPAPAPPVTAASAPQAANSSYTIVALTNQSKAAGGTSGDPPRSRPDGQGGNLIDSTKEQNSILGTINSSQQVSGLAMSSLIENELNSDASSCISASSQGVATNKKSVQEEHTSNISSSSSGQAVESQQQTADSTRSSIDSGNGTIASKPTTVIVGANLD